MVEALDALPLPPLSFQVNNRKLIQGFYRGLGMPDVTAAIRHHRQARQAAGRDGRRSCWSTTPGATAEQAERCLELATIRTADTSFVERVRALGVEDELLDEGLAELAAVVEGCAAGGAPHGHGRGQPAHRARPRLLHRHRRRDLHGRLRAPEVGRRRRPLRRARQRRPDDVPRRRRLLRRLPHARARCSPTACSPAAGRCRAPCWSPSSTRSRAPPASAVAAALRARGIPCEVAATAAEVRQADPVRRAPRHPVRLVPAGRRQPRGQGHPLRRPGGRRPGDLDPTRRATCDRRSSLPPQPPRRQHSDPHPRRRRPARRARRPDRHPRRLGGPPARPRRGRLPRPARGQRRRPGRRPRRGRRPQPAQRVLPQGHRRGRAAPGGQREPQPAHRRDRGRSPPTSRCSAPPRRCRSRSTTTSTVGEEARLKHRYLDLRRSGPDQRAAPAQQGQQGRPRRARRPRLRRDRDADPDPLHARGRPRLPGARPGCSPAAGTPCRRARSCSSSC